MKLDRRFVGAAAAVALLGGAGGAYAVASGGGHRASERNAFEADVAKRLNVSTDDLEAAFKGAISDKLDRAVAAGRLTRAQADDIEKRIAEHGAFPFPGPPLGRPPRGGPRPPGPPPPPGAPPRGDHDGPHGPLGAVFDAAAKYLGLSAQELHKQLEAGKSLADIAGDRGKSVDGLKSAIEDATTAELRSHLDDIVNGHPGDGPPGGFARRHRRHP